MAAAGRQTFPNEIEGLPDRSARKDRGTDTCRSADVRQNGQHHRRLRMSAILSRLPRIFQFQPRRPLDRPHLPGRHLGGESVPILLPGLSQAGRSPAQAFRPEGRHQGGRNADTYGSTRSVYQCTGPLRLFGRLEHYDRTTQGLLHILQSRFPAALHCPILSGRQQRMPQQGPANDVHADRFSRKGRKRCRQDHARLEKGKLPQSANRGDYSSRQSRIDIASCQFVVR